MAEKPAQPQVGGSRDGALAADDVADQLEHRRYVDERQHETSDPEAQTQPLARPPSIPMTPRMSAAAPRPFFI